MMKILLIALVFVAAVEAASSSARPNVRMISKGTCFQSGMLRILSSAADCKKLAQPFCKSNFDCKSANLTSSKQSTSVPGCHIVYPKDGSPPSLWFNPNANSTVKATLGDRSICKCKPSGCPKPPAKPFSPFTAISAGTCSSNQMKPITSQRMCQHAALAMGFNRQVWFNGKATCNKPSLQSIRPAGCHVRRGGGSQAGLWYNPTDSNVRASPDDKIICHSRSGSGSGSASHAGKGGKGSGSARAPTKGGKCVPCKKGDTGCTHPGNADQKWCDSRCKSGVNDATVCPTSHCACKANAGKGGKGSGSARAPTKGGKCVPCKKGDTGCTHPGNADQKWCDSRCKSGVNDATVCPKSHCACKANAGKGGKGSGSATAGNGIYSSAGCPAQPKPRASGSSRAPAWQPKKSKCCLDYCCNGKPQDPSKKCEEAISPADRLAAKFLDTGCATFAAPSRSSGKYACFNDINGKDDRPFQCMGVGSKAQCDKLKASPHNCVWRQPAAARRASPPAKLPEVACTGCDAGTAGPCKLSGIGNSTCAAKVNGKCPRGMTRCTAMPTCKPCTSFAYLQDTHQDAYCQDDNGKCWSSMDCTGVGSLCKNTKKKCPAACGDCLSGCSYYKKNKCAFPLKSLGKCTGTQIIANCGAQWSASDPTTGKKAPGPDSCAVKCGMNGAKPGSESMCKALSKDKCGSSTGMGKDKGYSKCKFISKCTKCVAGTSGPCMHDNTGDNTCFNKNSLGMCPQGSSECTSGTCVPAKSPGSGIGKGGSGKGGKGSGSARAPTKGGKCVPCKKGDTGCTHPGNADQKWCDSRCKSGVNDATVCPKSHCACKAKGGRRLFSSGSASRSGSASGKGGKGSGSASGKGGKGSGSASGKGGKGSGSGKGGGKRAAILAIASGTCRDVNMTAIQSQSDCEAATATLRFIRFDGRAQLNSQSLRSSRPPGCHIRKGKGQWGNDVWGVWFNPNAASRVTATADDKIICMAANRPGVIPLDNRPCPAGTSFCSASMGRKGGCFSPVKECSGAFKMSCGMLASITAPGACGSGCSTAFIDKVNKDFKCAAWNRTSTCTSNADCPAYASYCMNGAGKKPPFVCHKAKPINPAYPPQPTCSRDIKKCFCSNKGKNYVIKATTLLTGVTAKDFTPAVQETFKLSVIQGMPASLGLTVDSVVIVKISTKSRRADALSVEFSVDTGVSSTDSSSKSMIDGAAKSMSAYLKDSSDDGFAANLKKNVANNGQTFPVTKVAVTSEPSLLVQGQAASNASSDSGLAGGAVAGIVIACLVVAVVIGLVVWFTLMRKPASDGSSDSAVKGNPSGSASELELDKSEDMGKV